MSAHESLDIVTHDGVTVAARAPGARHPECGAKPDNQHLIRTGNDERRGPGRRWHKPASVVVGPDGPRWYCIEVAPRMERLAVAEIKALGLTALTAEYLASRKVRQRVRGGVRIVEQPVVMPAFPRYVFAEFDASGAGWRRIATRRGVKRLMGGDPERPQPVSAPQMAWVIAQFGEDGVQRRASVGVEPIAVGAMVRVLGGPLEGHAARVVASDGRSVTLQTGGMRVRMAQAAVALTGPSGG